GNMKTSSDMESMSSNDDHGFIRDEKLPVKEGMYVMMGETVFNIVDPHKVVVILQIKAEDLSKIQAGADVEITMSDNPEMVMQGKIGLIEPVFKEGSKTTTARVNIDNSSHNHKVGSFVKEIGRASCRERC